MPLYYPGLPESYAPHSRGTDQECRGCVPRGSGRDEPILDNRSGELTLPSELHDVIPGRGVLRISLTPVCNLRCSHCHNEGQAKPWLHTARTAPAINDVDALIRGAAKRGVKTVRFTGGEPGIYPHFYDLISAIDDWRSALPSIDKW